MHDVLDYAHEREEIVSKTLLKLCKYLEAEHGVNPKVSESPVDSLGNSAFMQYLNCI